MPRNPMQDIVPKGRSIRNVPVPESRVKAPKKAEAKPRTRREVSPAEDIIKEPAQKKQINILEREEVKPEEPAYEEPVTREEESARVPNWEALQEVRKEFETMAEEEDRPSWKKKSKKKIFITLLVLAVLGGGFALSSVFENASVAVVPRSVATAVESDYSAKKTAGAPLAFQVITSKETDTETVKAAGERKVDRKATGTVVIYNNYTSSAQRLIRNTRFATPEGLIFRITDSVTVPGKKGATPGSVEATIVADGSGDSYNVGLKDFTIPGFKGDPRYAGFYARSKTPISGGFSGTEKVVSEEDRAKAKAAIEARLTDELVKRIPTLVPEDKISFAKAYKISFVSLPEEASGSDVTIKSEGTLSLVAFDRSEISKAIAKNHIKDFKGDSVLVTNLDTLAFSPKGTFDPAGSDTVAFALKGNANIEWTYDEEAVKKALLGQPRSKATEILQKFPTIKSAKISLRPAWSRSFPDTLEKIVVEKGE